MATGATYHDLALRFRMGVSTVSGIVKDTSDAIWRNVQPIYMPFPTREICMKSANDYFQKWQLPYTFGAIDGKHIRILCPPNSVSSYYNYKQYFSANLQGVADASCR